MGRHDEQRERGVEGRLLDLTELTTEASDWVTTKRLDLVDQGVIGLKPGFAPWAVFSTPQGHTVVVCNEGVAYMVLPDEPMDLPLYLEYSPKSDGSRTMSMMPWTAKVDLDYIERNTLDETIDLADLIRSFGSRLEQNFRSVRRILTDEKAAQEAVDEWRADDRERI